MNILMRGVVFVSLMNLLNCRSIYHRLITGDHDRDRKVVITEEIISEIKPGITTVKDLDRIFNRNECHRWTYRKPFKVIWEGKEYRINGIRVYGQVDYYGPIEIEHGTVYGWKEKRWLRVLLSDDVVQVVIIRHGIRNERGRGIVGPLQNIDDSLEAVEKMNGLGCERRIYEVVSLGMKPTYKEEFEKYCRPLIIEE